MVRLVFIVARNAQERYDFLRYAFAGDEMPGWLEEWLPLASIVLGLAGGIGFVVSVVLLFVQAAS